MDKLDGMRLFVRVAEAGSFSTVARQLNVARSVVTRQVAALEAHLRTKLLARSTRKLSLTSAGSSYLERCRVILNLVEEAETGLAEQPHAPRGSIRMSLPLTYSLKRLAPVLIEFSTLYPEVELDMDFSDRHSNLIQEGIDLAVRITGRLEPGNVARKLGAAGLVIVASPAYLAQHGVPRHPAELIHHECLGYTGGPGAQRWGLMVNGKQQMFPVRTRFQGNNGEMLLRAAVAGLGITFQPLFSADEWIRRGKLRQILQKFPAPELGIYALLPGNRHIPHRVRVLMDFLDRDLSSRKTASSVPR